MRWWNRIGWMGVYSAFIGLAAMVYTLYLWQHFAEARLGDTKQCRCVCEP